MDIRSEKGLSLVEVVVTVAIMAIIIVPISLVFTTAYTNFTKESDKVAAQQAARDVLYGNNVNSYGVMNGIMGDLERSDAASSKIHIGDDDSTTTASSISIDYKDALGDSGTKKYSLIGNKLVYSDSNIKPNNYSMTGEVVDYFNSEKSSNGHDVVVKDFVVEKVKKVTDSAIDKDTDTDIIKITVTVTCGQSGDITLQSSYRIPNIER